MRQRMPQISTCPNGQTSPVIEGKLKQAKGTDAPTIFDTKIEAIRNLDLIISLRQNIVGILTIRNRNPPPILPSRPGAPALANDPNKRFHSLQYYSNVLECLGSETFSNQEIPKDLADKHATLIQKIVIKNKCRRPFPTDQRTDPQVQSTVQSRQISPPGDKRLKSTLRITGPNF
jgi:hypothetical protein